MISRSEKKEKKIEPFVKACSGRASPWHSVPFYISSHNLMEIIVWGLWFSPNPTEVVSLELWKTMASLIWFLWRCDTPLTLLLSFLWGHGVPTALLTPFCGVVGTPWPQQKWIWAGLDFIEVINIGHNLPTAPQYGIYRDVERPQPHLKFYIEPKSRIWCQCD